MKTHTTILRVSFGAALFLATMLPFGAPTTLDRAWVRGADGIRGGLLPMDPDCLPKDPPPPVVKLKVRVPACSEPGEPITYRICVENCSASEAHHVIVKNAIPSNAKFLRADPPPVKQATELQWNLGTVGAGAVREILLVLQPTTKEDVKNCPRVQFEHGVCLVTRQSGYPFLPDGAGAPTMPRADEPRPPKVTVVPDAAQPMLDLEIKGPKEQYANLATRYEITVRNIGKVVAANVQVSSRVSNKLSIAKVSDQGIAEENTALWVLGNLDPGASRVVVLTLKAKEAGDHCFTSKVLAGANDNDFKKELDFCTKFVGVSAMTIEMYDRDDPVFIGHKNSYITLIRNQGSAPLTNIVVKAFIPDSLKRERASAAFESGGPEPGGEWIEFKTFPKLDVRESIRYEVFVEAVRAGVTRFRIEVMANELDSGRPVVEEELTTIVDDREVPNVKKISRTK